MSGTIAITPQSRWSAAGWLFDWTVEFLAEHVGDEAAEQYLREVVTDNLGWVGFEDLTPEVRGKLLHHIRTELVGKAERELPETVPNRAGVLELLRELVRLAESSA